MITRSVSSSRLIPLASMSSSPPPPPPHYVASFQHPPAAVGRASTDARHHQYHDGLLSPPLEAQTVRTVVVSICLLRHYTPVLLQTLHSPPLTSTQHERASLTSVCVCVCVYVCQVPAQAARRGGDDGVDRRTRDATTRTLHAE